jgi:hypothetical protein
MVLLSYEYQRELLRDYHEELFISKKTVLRKKGNRSHEGGKPLTDSGLIYSNM